MKLGKKHNRFLLPIKIHNLMYSDVNEANYEDEDEDEDEDGYVTEFSQLSYSILVCGLSWLYLIKLASTSLRREILSKLP